jgi:hypothetical protein
MPEIAKAMPIVSALNRENWVGTGSLGCLGVVHLELHLEHSFFSAISV